MRFPRVIQNCGGQGKRQNKVKKSLKEATMDITSIIALLGAMSLSVERVVEIVKGMIPSLAQTNPDPQKENYRRAALQFIAVLVGTVIAIVTQDLIQPLLPKIFRTEGFIGLPGCIILGLLASGGSGFWNQCLTIVEEIRKTKKANRLSIERQQ